MAYTGSVDLISGIRPKNNGTFPLVDAKDVRITDTQRLSDWLSGGKISESMLPSYVDDVLEGYVDPQENPITTFYKKRTAVGSTYAYTNNYTPETGKIYVELVTGEAYRWGGSVYVKIATGDIHSIATGSTNGTIRVNKNGVETDIPVKGLKGLAYKDSLSKTDVGLGNVDNTSDLNKPISNATQNALDSIESRMDTSDLTQAKTALGNPIRIDDAVLAPLDKLTVKLEPKQDLHGYSKPWVGGAGKNLFDARWFAGAGGGSVEQVADGVRVYVNSEKSGNYPAAVSDEAYDFPAGTYTISCDVIQTTASSYGIQVGFRTRSRSSFVSPEMTSIGHNSRTYTLTEPCFVSICVRGGTSQTDAADYTVKNIIVVEGSTEIPYEPYENICPISGWDEIAVRRHSRNLIDFDKITKDRYVADTGTVNYSSGGLGVTDYIPVESGKTYQLMIVSAGSPVSSTRAISAFDSGNNFISPRLWAETVPADTAVDKIVDIEVPDNVAYLRINYYYNYDTVVFAEKAAVYRVSLSAAGGSVYGGQLTLNRDGSGTVTVDRGITDLGSLDWSYAETYSGKNVRWMSSIGLQAVVKRPAANTQKANAIFTAYENLPRDTVFNNVETNGVGTINSAGNVVIRDLSYSDSAEFKTAVTGQKVVYELATPQTFNLTAAQVKTLTGLNHISCDAGEMEIVYRADKYAAKSDFLATLPRLTASGNPITLTNGADGTPLKRLSIRIDPKQAGSGTPSPSNIRPISGWDGVDILRTGKNLLPPVAHYYTGSAIKTEVNSDGSVSYSGTPSSNDYFYDRIDVTLPAGSYVLSGGDGTTVIRLGRLDGSLIGQASTSPLSFTLSEKETIVIQYRVQNKASTAISGKLYPMIRKSTDSAGYEPYKGETYPIPFPPSIGTVYGANLVLEQDGSGTLTVDTVCYDIALLPLTQHATHKFIFYGDVAGTKAGIQDDKHFRSSAFETDHSRNFVFVNAPSLADNFIYRNNGANSVYIKSTMYQNGTIDDFKAAMNGQKVTLELATPVTYHLTAPMVRTLLGYNNLISDAGTMEIEYHADPQMYVDGSKVKIDNNATGTYTDTGVVWSANRTRKEANRKIPKVNPAFIGGIVGGLVEEEWRENKNYSVGTLVSVIDYAVDLDSGRISPDLSIVTIYRAKKDSYNVEPSEDPTAWLEAFTLSLADYRIYKSTHDGMNAEYISNKTPIRTLDWAGNETLAGRLTAEGNIKTNGYIVIGSTVLDETKLQKLLSLLTTFDETTLQKLLALIADQPTTADEALALLAVDPIQSDKYYEVGDLVSKGEIAISDPDSSSNLASDLTISIFRCIVAHSAESGEDPDLMNDKWEYVESFRGDNIPDKYTTYGSAQEEEPGVIEEPSTNNGDPDEEVPGIEAGT